LDAGYGDLLAHEVKYVTQTIEKIMSLWSKDGKRNFTVKVPKSHRIKEFELLLKQMLIHYQVPVRTTIQEVPIEIKCTCGYSGEARTSDPEDVIKVLCPNCSKNKAKVISGKDIEVF
jgi:Zn finger protein HypA/HybF involved in hydrogenase expression